MVLDPIEPVAPNSVTVRGAAVATGAKSTRGSGFLFFIDATIAASRAPAQQYLDESCR